MLHHTINPHYGNGCYRRRIRLQGGERQVSAAIEDSHHGFSLLLQHDGRQVVDFAANALRTPLSTCGGAVEVLNQLAGCPLSSTPDEIISFAKPREQCTHLHDLALLAIAHSQRGNTTRQYDIEIPDSTDGLYRMTLLRDGEEVLHWQVRDNRIANAVEAFDKPIMKGFYHWVFTAYRDDALEAALVLQRGYFVALARHYDMNASAGMAAALDLPMLGACYSYSPAIVGNAFRNANSSRDFSDTPEQLLKFL